MHRFIKVLFIIGERCLRLALLLWRHLLYRARWAIGPRISDVWQVS